ncbi:glycosyltransferase family 4 protein [Anaerococcus nagyae]|uniref:Glycosyltransferase n=1 Tax=Anaerococcus nagyae TaxID=1755241 RepID=A0A3E2TKN3_9FIRM|nr:glycosyltransferase family 4 protein [Anaerococcus nagyae]RGB77941.1 glycosyltransferase [Anaerococcus nagyae]
MKIWVIGRSYPMSINNMQGSFELEQAKMLAKYNNNDVSYITCVFHPYKKIGKWGYNSWEADNINIYTNSTFFAPERFKMHAEKYKTFIWKKFLKKVEEISGLPDIIHIHYPTNITIANHILTYKNKRIKIICTEHWSQVLNKTLDRFELNQLKNYVENSDHFLSVGSALQKSIYDITQTEKEIPIVGNVVNNYFIPIDRKKDCKIFKYIAVGNQVKLKRYDKIILSFYNLLKVIPNISLTLVGSGPEHNELIKLVKKLNIEDKVIFTGSLSRAETARYVGLSNVLLCFSEYETFGVPIIEAWACGLPVVTSDSISVNEVWDDRLGYKIRNANISDFSKKMKCIYENYEKFDKDYIRDYAILNYSEESMYNRLMYYYKND